jgi:hypothetical protein
VGEAGQSRGFRRARRPLPLTPAPQAGGKVLDAPAVEITYGLERILMARQGVKHFKDIRWGPHALGGWGLGRLGGAAAGAPPSAWVCAHPCARLALFTPPGPASV